MSNIVIQIPGPGAQQQGGYQQQPMAQSGFPQPQPGYAQPGYAQPGFPQPQPGYAQPGYAQHGYAPQSGYGQPQPGYAQPGYPQPQPGYAQPGFPQPQPGYGAQPYAPQPGYPPQAGHGQAGYPPQHPGMYGVMPKMVKGFDRLEGREGIFIKQKMELVEMVTGCEGENTYYVYPLSKDGEKKGKKLFKCKEKSGFCARQCLSGECRPFQLKINLTDESEQLDQAPFLLLDRPCACTFYCCNRPELTVSYVEDGKQEYLGKIRDPFNWCNIVLDIFDKDNNIKYKIDGSCCQIGMHCKGPFECCEAIDFDLKIPSGDTVASIRKKSPGCLQAMVSDADNFGVHFPAGATKEDKALIMCAVLFLDFRYFEESNQRNDNGLGL